MDAKIPPCSIHCTYARQCWDPWALRGNGALEPVGPWVHDADVWARWPDCPRHYLGGRWLVGGDGVELSEAIRWAIVRGLRRRMPSRAARLVRIWTRLDGAQGRLETHIAAQKR